MTDALSGINVAITSLNSNDVMAIGEKGVSRQLLLGSKHEEGY